MPDELTNWLLKDGKPDKEQMHKVSLHTTSRFASRLMNCSLALVLRMNRRMKKMKFKNLYLVKRNPIQERKQMPGASGSKFLSSHGRECY